MASVRGAEETYAGCHISVERGAFAVWNVNVSGEG
jgi:hypothetical protein